MVQSNSDNGYAEPDGVSERVVHAVANARDVDPLELPPLYDVVDPDALDKLFAGSCGPDRTIPGRIVFGVAGCEVTVYSDGRVDVDAHPEPRIDSRVTDRAGGGSGAETSVGE